MLRTLRGRITFAYVAFVMILFLIVAAVLAREAVVIYARSANDAVETATNQIHDIVANNPDASFTTLTSEIHDKVERPGLRIIGFEHPPGMTFGRATIRVVQQRAPGSNAIYIPMQPPEGPLKAGPGGSPPPPDVGRSSMDRFFFSVSNIAGIHPAHIDAKNASFLISSDPSRLSQSASETADLSIIKRSSVAR